MRRPATRQVAQARGLEASGGLGREAWRGPAGIIPRMPSRERLYRTEAVVLRRGEFGEADRILTAYSPEHGKLRLVAKGVRKARSRKAGHLEPFTRVELQIARGHDLDVITQATALDLHTGLHRDLERFGYAAYVVELMDRFTVQEGDARGLYRLLVDTLERLNEPSQPAAVVDYYQLRLLDLLGYRPELFRCLGCGWVNCTAAQILQMHLTSLSQADKFFYLLRLDAPIHYSMR